MTTGATLVQDVLATIGAYGRGDALDPDDAQLVLRTLNRMLESMSNERAMVYDIYADTFPTAQGTQAYSSGLLTAGRPINVSTMTATLSNVDYGIELINNVEWAAIAYKPVQSIPRKCYIDTSFPNNTFYFYPIPNAVYTVTVQAWRILQDTFTLVTNLALPPGYERAIVLQTAVEVAESFGKKVSPMLVRRATSAKIVLQRNNHVAQIMDYGLKDSPELITPLPPW